MATRSEAYVDTSALIAFADGSDTHHHLFARLFADPPSLVTTTLVVAEGHGWFLRRYGRLLALRFLETLERMAPLTVVGVGPAEQATAVDILRRFSDQDLTVVDAVGLHVMGVRGVQTCWSTDFHLGITGVRLVINSR
jgi:predicted nucleic acid-binding protein